MTEIALPVRTQAAILITVTSQATGMLVLYPDRLAHVKSQIARVCAATFRVKPGQWPSDALTVERA